MFFLSSEVEVIWLESLCEIVLNFRKPGSECNAYVLVLSMISLFSEQWLDKGPDLCLAGNVNVVIKQQIAWVAIRIL